MVLVKFAVEKDYQQLIFETDCKILKDMLGGCAFAGVLLMLFNLN